MLGKSPIALFASCCFLFATGTQAAVVAYEGFDSTTYTTGASGTGLDFPDDDLRGQGTGSGMGFTSTWQSPTISGADAGGGQRYWSNTDNSAATNYYRAATGQFTYTDGIGQTLVTTPGRAVFTTSNPANPQVSLERFFGTALAPGTPLYASALVTIDGTNHAYVGLASTASEQSDRPFQFGFNSARRLVIAANEDLPTDARRTLVSASTFAPGTYLLVARLTDDGTDNDRIDLWVNPTLGAAGEAAMPTMTYDQSSSPVDNNNFLVMTNPAWGINGFVLDSGVDDAGSAGFDELRFGTTFSDVTPVPEPATVGAAALAGVGLLLRRRRRIR